MFFKLVLYAFPASFLFWEANVHPCHLFVGLLSSHGIFHRGKNVWSAYIRTPFISLADLLIKLLKIKNPFCQTIPCRYRHYRLVSKRTLVFTFTAMK